MYWVTRRETCDNGGDNQDARSSLSKKRGYLKKTAPITKSRIIKQEY